MLCLIFNLYQIWKRHIMCRPRKPDDVCRVYAIFISCLINLIPLLSCNRLKFELLSMLDIYSLIILWWLRHIASLSGFSSWFLIHVFSSNRISETGRYSSPSPLRPVMYFAAVYFVIANSCCVFNLLFALFYDSVLTPVIYGGY